MATEFDAESVKNRITQRLSAKAAWQDILYFSTNNRIIDAVAEEIAFLASYDSYLTRESKWSLARNTSSLVALTPLHRYNVHRKQSATGTLRVCLSTGCITSDTWSSTKEYQADEGTGYENKLYKSLQISTDKQPDTNPTYWERQDYSLASNIGIPRFSLFSDGGDITFTNLIVTQLSLGDDYVDVAVTQGIPRTFNNTSTGIDNEIFPIVVTDIENSFIEGYINDVAWNQVDSLYLSDNDASDFELQNYIDFTGVSLKFGDNIFGKKLTSGDVVKLLYLESLGVNGNITSTGIINSVDSQLYTALGNEVKDISCSNITQLIGGTEIEEKEQIRANAPKTFQTGDRASTASDYEIIIGNNFSYIEKIIVWGAYETNQDQGLYPWTYIPLDENKVKVSALTTSLEPINVGQQIEISTAINQYKAPTDILEYVEAEVCNVIFDVDAYVTDTAYTLMDVRANIDNGLYDKYSAYNRDYFQHIRFSDYQAYIDGLEGVDWHDSSISFYSLLKFESAYDKITVLPLTGYSVTTVKIYVTDSADPNTEILIGTDNGAGIFTPEGVYVLTGSTIDYSTGDLTIDVVSGLSSLYKNYTIRVAYDIDNKNSVLSSRNQIFNYSQDYTTINVAYGT